MIVHASGAFSPYLQHKGGDGGGAGDGLLVRHSLVVFDLKCEGAERRE